MKKKIFGLVIGLSTILIFGLTYLISEKYKLRQIKRENEKVISKIILEQIDGSKNDLQSIATKPTIIFFFNTTCEHCQNEAKDIIKYSNKFTNTNVLWLSIEPIGELLKFEEKYKIQESISSLTIAKVAIKDVANHFNVVTNPTILIYKEQKLIKKFEGETKIEAILKYL